MLFNWLYNAMYTFVLMDLPQQGRSMKVAVGLS